MIKDCRIPSSGVRRNCGKKRSHAIVACEAVKSYMKMKNEKKVNYANNMYRKDDYDDENAVDTNLYGLQQS